MQTALLEFPTTRRATWAVLEYDFASWRGWRRALDAEVSLSLPLELGRDLSDVAFVSMTFARWETRGVAAQPAET